MFPFYSLLPLLPFYFYLEDHLPGARGPNQPLRARRRAPLPTLALQESATRQVRVSAQTRSRLQEAAAPVCVSGPVLRLSGRSRNVSSRVGSNKPGGGGQCGAAARRGVTGTPTRLW